MIPPSNRYVGPLLLLLAVALVPIVKHEYIGSYVDDCADPHSLVDAARIEGVARVRRDERPKRGPRIFIQGLLEKRPKTPRVQFQIRRNFSPSRIYMRPTYSLRGRFDPDRIETEWLQVGPDRVPIHWQMGFGNRWERVVGFVYVYGGRPVEHPFAAQLAALLGEFHHGARPLTIFLASGLARQDLAESAREPIRDWLAAAWRHYKAVCSD